MAFDKLKFVLGLTKKTEAQAVKPSTFPPSSADAARLAAYAYYRAIYTGNHRVAFTGEWTRKYPQVVIPNIASNIVKISADLLFGEDVTLEFDSTVAEADQEKVREIWERSDMQRLLYESEVDCASLGDTVFVAERGEDGLARIRCITPSSWFPTLNPDDIREEVRHEIMWVRENAKGKKYLRVVRHEKGKIYNELFILNGKQVGKAADDGEWAELYPDGAPEAEIDTGVEGFVLVHVPNQRLANEYQGRSDIAGLETMLEALDARMTQENVVLQRHSGPILGLPMDVFKSAVSRGIIGDRVSSHMPQGANASPDESKLDVVSLGINGEAPEYITWDGRLADNHDYISKLIEQIAVVSETAPQLINAGDWGAMISGRALKILLMRTLAKVNRKRLYYTPAIKDIMRIAQELEGMEPVKFSVGWSDGLPQDVLEAIEVEERKLAARLTTRERAIMAVDDIEEKAAKQIVKEVDAEDDTARNNEAVAKAATGGNQGIQRPTPIQVTVGS